MREKVLLVDDDEMLLTITAALLEKHGFEVLKANNGVNALDILKTSHPSVILLDDNLSKFVTPSVVTVIYNIRYNNCKI